MDEMEGSLLLLRFVAPATVVILGLFVFQLLAVAMYTLARWRATREPGDSQVGLKFALHYFAFLAFQIALAGVFVLMYALISPGSDGKGALYRAALALMVPGGLVYGLHLVLLRKTNDDAFLNVRRLFTGFNLVLTGLSGFVGLILGFQALFAKGSTNGLGHVAGSLLLVYGTAWIVLCWMFGKLVLGGGGFIASSGGTGMPGYAQGYPPPNMPVASGLPPLGGYPPPGP